MARTNDGVEILSGTLVFLFLTITIPAFLLYGLGAAGDETNLVKFFFYAVLGFSPILVNVVTVYLQNRGFFDQHPELKGFQYFTFHSPENTFLGKEFPNLMSAKVLLPLFFVVSMFFGAMVSINGQLAVGTPSLVTGSVSPGASLGLAVEPAVSAETLFFNVGLLFSFIGGIYFFLYGRGVSPRWSYVLSHILSVFITSILFLFYHSFRYGSQETSQASVLLLGFITNSLTAVTHSMIPAYLVHGSGNFFSKASSAGIFTSETSILLAVVGTLVSGVVLIHFLFKELGE
jgi:hypothetical protein